MNILELLDKIIGRVNQSIAAFGIAAGVLLSFVNVVLRYAFDMSLTWAGELTNYIFIWSAFFGVAYGFKLNTHISIDLIIQKIPKELAKFFVVLSQLITLVFLLFISYFGYELILLTIELEEISVDLDIPLWLVYLVLPIAFFTAGFRVFEKILETLREKPEDVVKEVDEEMTKHGVVSAEIEDKEVKR